MKPVKLGLLGTSAFTVVLAVMMIGSFQTINDLQEQAEFGKTHGHFTLVKYDSNMQPKQFVQTKNLIVDEGLDTMGDLIFPDINFNSNATDSEFQWIAIGGSNTAPSAGQTDLLQYIGCARKEDTAITGDDTAVTSGQVTVKLDVQFTDADCTGTVEEAGVFNNANASAGAGEMLARALTGTITFGSGDTLTVTYNITLTAILGAFSPQVIELGSAVGQLFTFPTLN